MTKPASKSPPNRVQIPKYLTIPGYFLSNILGKNGIVGLITFCISYYLIIVASKGQKKTFFDEFFLLHFFEKHHGALIYIFIIYILVTFAIMIILAFRLKDYKKRCEELKNEKERLLERVLGKKK